jgi:hypothetical protein
MMDNPLWDGECAFPRADADNVVILLETTISSQMWFYGD